MSGRPVRKAFAIFIAAPLFVFLAWFFGIFLQPQGGLGAGFAAGLITVSAIVALWTYAWIMKPGPKLRFRNRGVDGFDKDWGVGLTGYSQHQDGRRRRDDTEGDDLGGRRSSDEMDDDIGDGSPV